MNRRQFLKKLLALPAMALLLKGGSPTEYGPSPMEKAWGGDIIASLDRFQEHVMSNVGLPESYFRASDLATEWRDRAGNRLVTDYSSGYSYLYSRMRTYEDYGFYPTTKTYDLPEADQKLVRDYLAEPLPEIPHSVPYVTEELT